MRSAGPCQLQAAIAACHATAPDPASTDWPQIKALYAELARLTPSPVVDLNRAVAVAMADGIPAGLALVDELTASGRLSGYHLLPATRADLLRRAKRVTEARVAYKEALELAPTEAERRYLSKRRRDPDPKFLLGDVDPSRMPFVGGVKVHQEEGKFHEHPHDTADARRGRPGRFPGRTGRPARPGEGAHPCGRRDRGGPTPPPLVEVDAKTPLVGPDGPVTLLDAFEGRRQLIAYYMMWCTGRPATEQCEGCTYYNGQVRELSNRTPGITYATFCQGPYEESVRYRDFMGWTMPWYSAQDSVETLLTGRKGDVPPRLLPTGRRPRLRDLLDERPRRRGDGHRLLLMDMTVYGRQEAWEDSPAGWPRAGSVNAGFFRTNGRPTAQWPRLRPLRRPRLTPVGFAFR